MRVVIIIIFLSLLVYACRKEINKGNQETQVDVDKTTQQAFLIGSAAHDSSIFYVSKEGVVYLYFNKNKACFMFGINRCSYNFPLIVTKDSIKLIWSIEDYSCDYEIGLNKFFTDIDTPREGQAFAEIRFINENTINIDYYYKDFFMKINSLGAQNDLVIDTLFPYTFSVANK